MSRAVPEVGWFSALCDDDYEYLGVPDPSLLSSWQHCRDIVLTADRNGFDNVLLPSGYAMGIDAVSFAGGIGPLTDSIHLLLAVRMGEMWLPQLARQIATLDEMCGGRLNVNIISSDLPGQTLESEPRYRRTIEHMHVLRQLLDGQAVDFHGDFVDLALDAPRVTTINGRCPPFYFGGFSPAAKDTAAAAADVFLTWPDTVSAVAETVADMRRRADAVDRRLRYGLRVHVIVRETEAEARMAAERLVSRIDADVGTTIRNRSLDTASAGVSRQNALRDDADDDGYAEPNLWTGVGRARSGAGAALVGNPQQIIERIGEYQDVGIDAFIFSGYPHIGECELFSDLVLSQIEHEPLKPKLV